MGFLNNIFGNRNYREDVIKNMVKMAQFIIQKSQQNCDFPTVYRYIYLPVLGILVKNNTDKQKYIDYFKFMTKGPSIMTLIHMYGVLSVPKFPHIPYEDREYFTQELFDIQNAMYNNGVPNNFFNSSGDYMLGGNSKIAEDIAKEITNSISYKPFFKNLGIDC